MTTYAIIPVKERSTRFPGKNFASLAGKPLITHAVEKLLKSGTVDEVLISTDTGEKVGEIIASMPEERVHILPRSPWLAEDTTSTDSVVGDVIERQVKPDPDDIVVLTQVTSPLWEIEDLFHAVTWLIRRPETHVVSVNPAYQPNGNFYIFKVGVFRKTKSVFGRKPQLYVLPFERSIDIDYPYQLAIAEALYKGAQSTKP